MGSSHNTHAMQQGRWHHEPWLHKADHRVRETIPWGLREGLGLAITGCSGVRLHALFQFPESLDKLLCLLVGAALQHPQC